MLSKFERLLLLLVVVAGSTVQGVQGQTLPVAGYVAADQCSDTSTNPEGTPCQGVDDSNRCTNPTLSWDPQYALNGVSTAVAVDACTSASDDQGGTDDTNKWKGTCQGGTCVCDILTSFAGQLCGTSNAQATKASDTECEGSVRCSSSSTGTLSYVGGTLGVCTILPSSSGTCTIDGSTAAGTCTAGACQDPHFFGFDGSNFDFQGKDGRTYNLITDSDHLINMLIVRRGQHYHQKSGTWKQLTTHKNTSTWIGGVGFRYLGDSASVVKNPDHSIVVTANGAVLREGDSLVLPGGLEVTYTNVTYAAGEHTKMRFSHTGDYSTPQVVFRSPVFSITAEAPPTFSRRMDVSFGLRTTMRELAGKVDGIMGQTVRTKEQGPLMESMEEAYPDTTWVFDDPEKMMLRVSMQMEREYTRQFGTSGLLMSDFARNLYIEVPASAVSSRKLIELAPAARGGDTAAFNAVRAIKV